MRVCMRVRVHVFMHVCTICVCTMYVTVCLHNEQHRSHCKLLP